MMIPFTDLKVSLDRSAYEPRLPDVIRMVKASGMGWEGYVVCMGEV